MFEGESRGETVDRFIEPEDIVFLDIERQTATEGRKERPQPAGEHIGLIVEEVLAELETGAKTIEIEGIGEFGVGIVEVLGLAADGEFRPLDIDTRELFELGVVVAIVPPG